MTTAYWSMGTLLQRQNPVSSAWETLPGVQDIAGPTEEKEIIDITNHSSPDGREEYIGGLKRSGDVSFNMWWDPANAVQLALKADYDGNYTRAWRIVLTDPGTATITFSAFVRTHGFAFPVNNAAPINVTLKVTGTVTVTQ
jgi:predicted secreted protein